MLKIRSKPCARCPALAGYDDAEFSDMLALYQRGLLKPSEIAYPCAFDTDRDSVCCGIAQRAGITVDDIIVDQRKVSLY